MFQNHGLKKMFPIFIVLSISMSTIVSAYHTGGHKDDKCSPLIKISEPLLRISKFYCSKPMDKNSWYVVAYRLHEMVANENNISTTKEINNLSDTMERCARIYKGDPDDTWRGYKIQLPAPRTKPTVPAITTAQTTTVVPSSSTTTKPPVTKGLIQKFFDNIHEKYVQIKKWIMGYYNDKRKKRDVGTFDVEDTKRDVRAFAVEDAIREVGTFAVEDAVGIIRLSFKIFKKACAMLEPFPVDNKHLRQIQDMMEKAVMEDIYHNLNEVFAPIRQTLEGCLVQAKNELWETSDGSDHLNM